MPELKELSLGYDLTEAIEYTIDNDGGNEFLIYCNEFQIYGDGETLDIAIEDFKLEIIDLYEDLVETPDSELSAAFIEMKNKLNRYITLKEV